ncbi:MAG: hypothetical protein ACE148_13285 [Vicinamibacterales bacterium]
MRSVSVCALLMVVLLLPGGAAAQTQSVTPEVAAAKAASTVPPAPAFDRSQAEQQSYDPDEYNDYIALYYGVNFGGGLFDSSPFESFDTSNPKAMGVAVGFWGSGMLSGELDFCYSPEFFGPKDEVSDNNLMSVTASFVINPTVRFGSQKVRPYVLVGGGLMRTRIEDFKILGKDVKNQGVVDIGGGLQYYFHPRIGIRGDMRYFMGVGADDTDDDGWGLIDDWNYYRGTIGIAFTF